MNGASDTPGPHKGGVESDASSPLGGDAAEGGKAGDSIFRRFWGFIRSLFGLKETESSLRGAIEELIEKQEADEKDIDEDARVLLSNILELHDVTLADVMVPRADIVAVEIETPLSDLIGLVNAQSHSRMPVFREGLDDVAGIVHIKDVLAWVGTGKKNFSIDRIMRKPLFAAPSMRVLDLLLEMRQTRNHMALVVDEFGGIDGLVTIEDLVEEIVGEIEDEHDSREEEMIVEKGKGTFDVNARTELEEFERLIGPILSNEEREEDIDTIGGLVFSLALRVPGRGEIIRHPGGYEFEILDADPRRIKRLRVRCPDPVIEAAGAPQDDKGQEKPPHPENISDNAAKPAAGPKALKK